ncbi:MAG: hypothetical protein BWK80_14240 [Desulfobacteraceae bacterium IS3]|nr:MAG: hypothetical protein BWK80_14240 [Desulfobacteraceae bacterium IS3]
MGEKNTVISHKRLRIAGFIILFAIWVGSAYWAYSQKEKTLRIHVTMSAWQSGFIQLFADAGQGFSENLSAAHKFIGNGLPSDYSFSFKIHKDISALRLDPINTQGMIRISRIRVSWQGREYVFKGKDLEKWQTINEIVKKSYSETDGITFDSTGIDPQMMIRLPLSYSPWKYIFLFIAEQWLFIILGMFFIFLGIREKAEQCQTQKIFYDHLVAAACPVFLFWILYHSALNGWWLYDDPCHLVYVLKNGLFSAFYAPDKGFSYANFTPMEPLSLGIDFHISGFDPKGFYWHQLLSFSGAVLAGYILLSRFFSPLFSSFILSLFVTSQPSCDAVFTLMVRHYVEGLMFTLISIHLFAAALEKKQLKWAYIGAFFYLSACLSKELYVPLVVILLFFPEISINIRSRLKFLYPYFGVILIYIIWRLYMLRPQALISGYSHVSTGLNDFLSLHISMVNLMGRRFIITCFLSLIFLLKIRKRSLKKNMTLLVFAICCLLPIVPVISILSSRYLFVFSFLLCVCAGLSLQHIAEWSWIKPYRNIVVSFIGITLILINSFSVQNIISNSWTVWDRMKAEGNFLLHHHDSDIMLLTEFGHCYEAFYELRKEILRLPPGPSYCRGGDEICTYLHPDKKLYKYNGEQFILYDKTLADKSNPEEWGQRKEMSVDISYKNEFIEWQFGPYSQGTYMLFAKIEELGNLPFLPLQRRGKTKYKIDMNNVYFIVKYQSSEGWETYSPRLKFDMDDSKMEGRIRWSRTDNK